MKVTGIGQCAFDNLFIIDGFPAPDTKKEISESATAGGGPVATALVSLSRLGVACSFHGIIGDDEAGTRIADSIRSEKVDVSGLLIRPGSSSQVAYIAVEKESGKRTIFWKRPSAEPLKPHELSDDFLDDTDFLLLDGLMAETSLYAARKARERNVPVMLDAGRVREGMIELARLCDYVVCSEEFAAELAGSEKSCDIEKAVIKMKPFNAKAFTITLGDREES